MATLLQDNFDRANNTTVLGSPQVGPAPTIASGVMGISGNLAYVSTVTGIAVYNLGTTDVELGFDYSVITTTNSAAVVLGYTSLTDFYMCNVYSDRIELYKNNLGGPSLVATSYAKPPTASGSAKAHYKDGIIRAYIGGVLALRYVVDVPITGTSHGFRATVTSVKFDNLLGVDAPTITEAVPNGQRVDQAKTLLPASTFVTPSFAYLGRDTKLQDISVGA